MTKLTLIEQANKTLRQAQNAFDTARSAVSGELLELNKDESRPFNQCPAWNDLYYAMPNSNQVAGYLVKAAKFVAKYPEKSQAVALAAQGVEVAAKAVAVAKAALVETKEQVKAARAAKLADKGDQNLIAAMAEPRAEYCVRCVQFIKDSLLEIAIKLEAAAYNINVAYPYPGRDVRERAKALMMTENRRYAEKFFNLTGVDNNTVAVRNDIETVIATLADKMVSDHFDGYIYKLSRKIGKPVATAKHQGSIWNNCTLTVTCQDGDTQVWHTKCIFNRSVLGKYFNQWPTRRQS